MAVVETEWAEIVRVDTGDETKLHPAAQHLVDEGDLFGEPQRMIERHDVPHRPDAHPLGAGTGADRV